MRIRYMGDGGNRLLSGFWGPCPIAEIQRGAADGCFHLDDMHEAGGAISTNTFEWQGESGNYFSGYGTSGVTQKAMTWVTGADAGIGVLELDTDAAGEETYIQASRLTYNSQGIEIDTALATWARVWFEARVRWDTVASTTGLAKAVGLASLADHTSANQIFAADGLTTAIDDFVGFRAIISDGDGMDCTYEIDDTEAVALEAASTNNLAIEADTWYKFGLYYENRNALHYYLNGVRQVTIDPATLGSAFPASLVLYPTIGVDQSGSGDFETDIDFVAWAIAR